jgi:1-acyl-sn-glycerol-3-phosphate acyltransferase
MGNLIALFSILALFMLYDPALGLARLLVPRKAFEISEHFTNAAVRHIFSIMAAYARVHLEVENPSGIELPERFLLLTNHQSLMDIPAFIALFPGRPLRFVAKRELGKGIPFVSRVLRGSGHALVERDGDAGQAMRSIRRFARRCEREGSCPVIFPEGTRSRDGEVGTFHTAGVRKILDETPLPLVVAVLDGGWRIATLKDLLLNLRDTRFRMRLLSVTPTLGAKKEVLEAIASARISIVAGLEILRAKTASEKRDRQIRRPLRSET